MPAKLVLQGDTPQEYHLGSNESLGRHPENSIQVLDRIVSKEHATLLELADGRFKLTDCGSLNGTYINGERVAEKVLHSGDEITMGTTTFVYSDDYEEPKSVAPSWEEDVRDTRPKQKLARRFHEGRVQAHLSSPQAPSAAPLRNVTLMPGQVQSEIRKSVDANDDFLPASDITNEADLRADYEKLRAAHEIGRKIALHTDLDQLLEKIVDETFRLIRAERSVVLLYDREKDELLPQFVRHERDEEIRLSTSILDDVKRNKRAVLSSDASMDARFKASKSVIMQGIRSTMCVPMVADSELIGVIHMDSTVARGAFTEKDLQVLTGIATQAAAMVQNQRLAKKIETEAAMRAQFERLVSPNLVDEIISGAIEVRQGGEELEVTMLFADIRGFTSMSETRTPKEIVATLNSYFEAMVEVLFAHGGTLDKYVGDEIIGLFGAPVAQPDAPQRAVECAVAMMARLETLNYVRQRQGQPAIEIGIGLNTGKVLAGAIGSPQTLQYTVIGDAVNTAARLCSSAAPGEIIISTSTQKATRGIQMEARPAIRVKGKAEELEIFAVTHGQGADSTLEAVV